MNKIQGDLRKIITICLKNIKGLTKCEEIDNIIPIYTNKINIEKKDRKIVFSKENKILGTVWREVGCYSNLEILTLITKEYGIEPKNDRSLELMKYKYKIDNILM